MALFEVAEQHAATLGEEHPETLASKAHLARALAESGDLTEAADLANEVPTKRSAKRHLMARYI